SSSSHQRVSEVHPTLHAGANSAPCTASRYSWENPCTSICASSGSGTLDKHQSNDSDTRCPPQDQVTCTRRTRCRSRCTGVLSRTPIPLDHGAIQLSPTSPPG